jgi:hypothetical protein
MIGAPQRLELMFVSGLHYVSSKVKFLVRVRRTVRAVFDRGLRLRFLGHQTVYFLSYEVDLNVCGNEQGPSKPSHY